MRTLGSLPVSIQLARVPEHAEFRGILCALFQAISHLHTVKLPYKAVIRLALLMKEIEKNCWALKLEAESEFTSHSSKKLQSEIEEKRITGITALRSLIYDAEKLATEDNATLTPFLIQSSKHRNVSYGQYGIVFKIQEMISAYIGLLNVLTSSASDRKSRLPIALSLVASEKDFYHFIAVSRSEYTGV